mgnify:CR=1 FL=1
MPDTDRKEGSDPAVEITGQPFNALGSGLRTVIRQVVAIIGLLLIALAIPIGILTPLVPIGLPIAIVGVILLGRNAVWGRRWMEGMIERHPTLERFAPGWLMRVVFGREKNTPPR